MSDLSAEGGSPFDSIRQVDERGEFWSARDVENAEAALGIKALRLLESAASIAMERRFGAARDASSLYAAAMDLPSLVDCTMIANAVLSKIVEAANFESSEPFLHSVFAEFHPRLIPGSHLTTLKNDAFNIPDFWVMVEGSACPVEIKDHAFDSKAMAQLKRYMSVYGKKRGFAVAPSSKVSMPDGVTFVCLSREIIEELHRQRLIGE